MKGLNNFVLLGVLAALSAMNVAQASEEVGQWYGSGLLTYIDPDSDRNLDSEIAGLKLAVGRAVAENWNVEGEASFLSVSGDGGPDTDFTGLLLNGMYLWNRSSKFTPYLLAGAGYLDADPDAGPSNEDLQVQAGPGFYYDLGDSDNWSMRAELLARWADDDKSSAATDLLLNIGVQYAFGGKSKSSAKAAPAPAPAAASSSSPPLAAGALAAVPLDTDGDGVPDLIDECPDTIEGAKVDEVGCQEELTLSGTSFALNSVELSEEGMDVLTRVAEGLKSHPDQKIIIEGYTDSSGAADYNQQLSERRAKSARDFLVRKGVAGTRITAVGRGEENPIASNETKEGQAQNRRVVLRKDNS